MEELRNLMNCTSNIRNVSVIGNMNHGKSTLKDSLVARAGNISSDDASQHEQFDNNGGDNNSMTIKSTALSICYSPPNTNDIHNDKEKDSENKKVNDRVYFMDEKKEKKRIMVMRTVKLTRVLWTK
ncbi:unnamed protein product [Cunninghamella echinulata]